MHQPFRLPFQENTPMQLQVSVAQDALGVLTPNFIGPGKATVTINDTPGAKTATIAFAGMNQALVTFDAFGMKGISYTALNPMHDQIIAQSIENIMQHMNANMLG
jgi:hypothetical protein